MHNFWQFYLPMQIPLSPNYLEYYEVMAFLYQTANVIHEIITNPLAF